MGGHINIGIDGPWDVHRILGTVPVEADGSASFRVPANTPDRRAAAGRRGQGPAAHAKLVHGHAGRELLLRRLPRHAELDPAEPSRRSPASASPRRSRPGTARRAASASSARCSRCWTSTASAATRKARQPHNGQAVPDFTAKKAKRLSATSRRPTSPCIPSCAGPGRKATTTCRSRWSIHADTSELVQMLKRGHHNVKLDAEAWDRLITWIDLNVPDHGTWTEHVGGTRPVMQRRLEMHAKYANRTEDPEAIPDTGSKEPVAVRRARAAARAQAAGPSRGRLAVRRRRGGQAASGRRTCRQR